MAQPKKFSAKELDSRILRLGKSIKKRTVSEDKIVSDVKSFRRKTNTLSQTQ